MAYANTTRAAPVGLLDRIAQIYRTLAEATARRRIYRQTRRELNALTARELADLGIHRSQITRIALEAAYGK